MTRAQIVAEAGRRLGDTSAAFLAEINAAFDFVLGDLAASEAIGDLQQVHTAAVLVADQRDYSTQTLSGVAAPNFPDRILSLRVWDFGVDSLLEQVSDAEFEQARACDGELTVGRPRRWRPWPNSRQVQLHPPADGDADGAAIECVFLAPPATIAGGDPIDQVRAEDLETIVFGLKARLAPFLDESVADPQMDWQLYVAGRDRMWGRRHNRGVGTMGLVDQ